MASDSQLYVTDAPAPPAPNWRWRAGATAALLAALALLALTLAHWGWTWFGPAPASIATPVPDTDLARRVAEAHLFGSAGAARTPAQADRAASGLKYLEHREAGEEVAPGVRIESVRPEGVSLVEGGARRDLALHPAGVQPRVVAAAPPVSAACAPPPGFKGPVVRLNAELLGGMIDAPGAWKVLVAPASGALVVRDQSGFAGMLGLKNGDRVERANGIALAVPDDIAATILRPLTRSEPVWLAGTRDGRPQQWLYLNAGSCPG